MAAIDSRLFEAGFALADVARWSRFVATGELARTLTHACLLVKPRLALGYTLVAAGGGLGLSITIVGAYPAADLKPPPRLPRIDEIVSRANIQDNDFKCSARPSDFVDLIGEIARFARVAVEVDDEIRRDGESFVVSVSYRGAPATIRLEDTKYVDVTPILEYLDARRLRRQLYYVRMGGYAAGLVRATDAEVLRLRVLGYVG